MTTQRSTRSDNQPETIIDCANLVRANGYGVETLNDQRVLIECFFEVRQKWIDEGYAALTENEKVSAFEAAITIAASNLWSNGGKAAEMIWSFNQQDGPTYFRPNYTEST